MKQTRKGYGINKGQGYKNLMPMDSYVHSLSARGCKSKTKLYAKQSLTQEERREITKIYGNAEVLSKKLIKEIRESEKLSMYLFDKKTLKEQISNMEEMVGKIDEGINVLQQAKGTTQKVRVLKEERKVITDFIKKMEEQLNEKGKKKSLYARATKTDEEKVKKTFIGFLNSEREKEKEYYKDFKYHKYSDPFADVQVKTDKVMEYKHNDDESKGWTGVMSYMDKKPKDSNVVIVVTYDGAGYDYFSPSGDYLKGRYTDDFQKMLDKKFGKEKYHIEHNNNWSFSVYKEE